MAAFEIVSSRNLGTLGVESREGGLTKRGMNMRPFVLRSHKGDV